MRSKILPLAMPQEGQTFVDVEQIKHALMNGIDDSPPEDRALAWLVLSNIYPKNPNDWNDAKKKYLDEYINFIKFFKMEEWETKFFSNDTEKVIEFGTESDDLMTTIHTDIVRTQHHIPFFPFPEEIDDITRDILAPFRPHMRRIERILYIQAKLDPGLSYAQGFNELICPIFFTLLSAKNILDNSWDMVEALSFYMFQKLLSSTGLNDLYMTQDKSSIIIHKMEEFMQTVRRHLPREAAIIEHHQIAPTVFAFPWLCILFAQFFMIPDLVVIWDSLFVHFDILLQYSNYIGTAIIFILSDRISEEDYVETMTVLKKAQLTCVTDILRFAYHCLKVDNEPKPKSLLDDLKSKIKPNLESFKNFLFK